LMQDLRIGPYESFGRLTFTEAARQHAGKVLIGMLGFVSVLSFAFVRARQRVERSVAMHGAHEGEYGVHSHHDPHVGMASATALVAHSFLDGVGIGLAFQVDDTVGYAVAVAVIAHDFADGLNTVTVMRTHGNSHRRQVVMLVMDSLAPVLGALSTLFFSVGNEILALYLGGFAGFLLYLATADILPEAHARHPSRLTLVSTLGGVGLMWIVVAAS